MTMKRAARRFRIAWVSLVSCLLLGTGCSPEHAELPEGVLVVAQEQAAAWTRTFNPLSAAAGARWPTLAGIYEPLYVFNSVKAEQVPWLATAHEWRDGNRVLRITTRENVKWSDGQEFSAADVVFTFKLLQEYSALDRRGLWGFIEDVVEVDARTVDFQFQRVFVPGLDEVVAQQIVPAHIWSEVEDPVAFQNETPVATGPFTEIRFFRNQVWELGRNPHYWQEGKPYVDALRFPAYPSNDRSNLALVFDEVDWAAKFVPAIDRVFVERNKEHHKYWFPLTGSTVFLYANTTRQPFDDVQVRKAISMAIDRELLVNVAAYRYSKPADATALSDAYVAWRDEKTVEAHKDWVSFDAPAAAELLDGAGLRVGEDGIRRESDGTPLRYDILTVSGWSDWVRAAQVISRGLRDIGIESSVRTYDFGAWFQRVQEGDFDLCLGWSFEGPTPYTFYRWLMASSTVKPPGEVSMGNWHRFGSARADELLSAFEIEADPVEQHRLANEMQSLFAEEAPAIPLYPNPSWAEYNTSRFVGFPSAEDPYADPSPNKADRGEVLLVLTTVRPR